jgi:hypothetical protein
VLQQGQAQWNQVFTTASIAIWYDCGIETNSEPARRRRGAQPYSAEPFGTSGPMSDRTLEPSAALLAPSHDVRSYVSRHMMKTFRGPYQYEQA